MTSAGLRPAAHGTAEIARYPNCLAFDRDSQCRCARAESRHEHDVPCTSGMRVIWVPLPVCANRALACTSGTTCIAWGVSGASPLRRVSCSPDIGLPCGLTWSACTDHDYAEGLRRRTEPIDMPASIRRRAWRDPFLELMRESLRARTGLTGTVGSVGVGATFGLGI